MSAVQRAERAARRYVDSAPFLRTTAVMATRTVEVIESALADAVRPLTPDEVDDLLRSLGDELPTVLAVLEALDEL